MITSDEIIRRCLEGSGLSLRPFPEVRLWPQPMEFGKCFYNACALSRERPDLSVVVGHVIFEGLVSRHAWVVDGDGISWEPTLGVVAQDYRGVLLTECDPD